MDTDAEVRSDGEEGVADTDAEVRSDGEEGVADTNIVIMEYLICLGLIICNQLVRLCLPSLNDGWLLPSNTTPTLSVG